MKLLVGLILTAFYMVGATPIGATPIGATPTGATPTHAQEVNPVIGSWLGTLDTGGPQLRILVEIEEAESGLTAKVTSLDQNNAVIPVSEVSVDGSNVELVMPAIGGGIKGVLSEDGETITATFSQAGNNLPLVLERTEGPVEPTAGPNRPQNPREPYPYRSEDVVYTNPDGGHTLAGTLTLPEGGAPTPAAILISGSGPQNRDEELLGHKPFLVLADHLTRNGIAVLRVDDRGVGESKGDFAVATSADFASDVEAGLAFLAARPDIDTDRIGLIGHSEGGLIAPMVASRASGVAYIVLLAGPGTSGAEILKAQQALIMEADGSSEESIAQAQKDQARLLELIQGQGTAEELTPELTSLVRGSLERLSDLERSQAGISGEDSLKQRTDLTVAQLVSPWFRYFVSYDPRDALEKVSIPVLALNGEKDLQVPFAANLAEIEAALSRGGNSDMEIVPLPGLNHLFQHAETGSPSEYQTIEETFAPDALEIISNWITARFGPP